MTTFQRNLKVGDTAILPKPNIDGSATIRYPVRVLEINADSVLVLKDGCLTGWAGTVNRCELRKPRKGEV
jgi:hypothetical protein